MPKRTEKHYKCRCDTIGWESGLGLSIYSTVTVGALTLSLPLFCGILQYPQVDSTELQWVKCRTQFMSCQKLNKWLLRSPTVAKFGGTGRAKILENELFVQIVRGECNIGRMASEEVTSHFIKSKRLCQYSNIFLHSVEIWSIWA